MGDMDINGSVHRRRHENVVDVPSERTLLQCRKPVRDSIYQNAFPFSFQVCMGFHIQSTVSRVVRKYVLVYGLTVSVVSK